MSYIEQLRKLIPTLELAYETAKSRIEKDMPGVNPFEVCDTNGRFLLVDLLVALVNAKNAIYEWDAA